MLKFTVWEDKFNGYGLLPKGSIMLQSLLRDRKFQNLFVSDYCKSIVKDIDKSEIVSPFLVYSPILGSIPPERLSGGVSTLLTIYLLSTVGHKFYFKSSNMGNNCTKHLIKLAKKYDLNMLMVNPIELPFNPNLIYSMDEDRFINSKEDLEQTYRKLRAQYLSKWNKDNYNSDEEAEEEAFILNQLNELFKKKV